MATRYPKTIVAERAIMIAMSPLKILGLRLLAPI